jgi:preprotein translocase subunit SecE
MARPTRQQRRARRIERSQSPPLVQEAVVARQARSFRTSRVEAHRGERERGRGGIFRFIGESVGELKKVEWPGRQQLIQGTAVVLIACAIVGGYLALADLALRHFVSTVLLGQ